MLLRKESELQRAEYYKRNLKKISLFYEPAIQLQRDSKVLSDSMVGELVLSPFLTLFTIWILQSAKKDGVARLYFLARDGYPVYKIACRLCKEYDIRIECKYLYCSRYSLRVPMYSENAGEMLEYICRSGIDVSLRKVLKRAGLQEDIISQLERKELGEICFDDRLSYSQLSAMKQILSENVDFLRAVTENSKEKWEFLLRYFIQEGLTDDKHIGLVDSGWIGSTQKSVFEILKRMGISAKIDGYYWGLYDIPDDMEPNRYHGFLFDKKHGMKNKLFFSNCLIETVFSNTHGTTVSYKEQKGKMVPVLQNKCSNVEFITNLNYVLGRYGEHFIKNCSKETFAQIDAEKSIKVLSNSLLRFMYDPTVGEAELFGSLHFSDDLLDDNEKELAPIFTERELKENHFFNRVFNATGCKSSYIHESAWFSATVRRSTDRIKWHDYSYLVYRLISYLKKSL